MVATHIPSNVLLVLVPLMPTLPLAMAMLLARFSISQMDVPTRQAYTMALVVPGERSAAAGVTGIARTLGAALSPMLAGPLYASAGLASVPFFVAGGLKIAYDLLIWRTFRQGAAARTGVERMDGGRVLLLLALATLSLLGLAARSGRMPARGRRRPGQDPAPDAGRSSAPGPGRSSTRARPSRSPWSWSRRRRA